MKGCIRIFPLLKEARSFGVLQHKVINGLFSVFIYYKLDSLEKYYIMHFICPLLSAVMQPKAYPRLPAIFSCCAENRRFKTGFFCLSHPPLLRRWRPTWSGKTSFWLPRRSARKHAVTYRVWSFSGIVQQQEQTSCCPPWNGCRPSQFLQVLFANHKLELMRFTGESVRK